HAVRVRGRGDNREARRERVHPSLLAVVGQVRVDGGEERTDPAGRATEERAGTPVRKRDARDRGDQRERVRRTLAVAEPADPDVEGRVEGRGGPSWRRKGRDGRRVVGAKAAGNPSAIQKPAADPPRARQYRERTQKPRPTAVVQRGSVAASKPRRARSIACAVVTPCPRASGDSRPSGGRRGCRQR